MITAKTEFVETDLGRLQVRRAGVGRPVLLWHSLFVDSRSWGTLFDRLAADRAVVAVDGPGHGGSAGPTRDFTFGEVADAAVVVLDRCGLSDPIDWVGNAWGGHVGIQVAARHPGRLRTLAAIGTPVRGLSARERWAMCWPLVQLYRLVGPNRQLSKILADALIGPEAVAAQPDRAAEVLAAFATARRGPMFHAMRSMMLHRPGMAGEMSALDLPVLLLASRDDAMGWRPADARAVAATMKAAEVGEVAGAGHVASLLIDTDTVLRCLADFWRNHPR